MAKAFQQSAAQEMMTPYLASNYDPIPESGCWLWAGSWNRTGYGKAHSKQIWDALAHRLFYAFYVGDIPEGMQVNHKCDTPACVNPSHLYAGTHKENMRDMQVRNRAYGKENAGENNGQAKLNTRQVLDIYSSTKSRLELANQYGVVYATILNIKTGINWAATTGHRRESNG